MDPKDQSATTAAPLLAFEAGAYVFHSSVEPKGVFGSADFPTLWGEVEAWLRRRDSAEAAHELAVAVRELHDPALQPRARRHGRHRRRGRRVGGPSARHRIGHCGFALCWLVDHGLEHQRCLLDPDDPYPLVDVLAHRLVTAGPKGLCATLALAGNHDQQIAVIGRLWRSPSTATDNVLAAIGKTHPSKIVAKAARRASFQRRSWLAR